MAKINDGRNGVDMKLMQLFVLRNVACVVVLLSLVLALMPLIELVVSYHGIPDWALPSLPYVIAEGLFPSVLMLGLVVVSIHFAGWKVKSEGGVC
jgi:hypothetical protein